MSGNFCRFQREMSGISVESREMPRNCQREKSSREKLPRNFRKNCVNRLFNITYLVSLLSANYFMPFSAE